MIIIFHLTVGTIGIRDNNIIVGQIPTVRGVGGVNENDFKRVLVHFFDTIILFNDTYKQYYSVFTKHVHPLFILK